MSESTHNLADVAVASNVSTGDPVTEAKATLTSKRWVKFTILQTARLSIAVVILGAWQLAAGHWIRKFWISSPSDIWTVLRHWIADGTLARNLSATFTAMIFGLVLGVVGGIVVGFSLGRLRWLAQVLNPLIVSIYALPKIALAPLFVLWFGIGLLSKVVLAAIICFFLVFYNTFSGVREVDNDLIDVLRVMGGRRSHVLWKVVLPSSAAWIFTGVRMAVPYALVGAVVGEIVASDRGMGYLIANASGTFDTAALFAALFVLMIVAVILDVIVHASERWTSRWKIT